MAVVGLHLGARVGFGGSGLEQGEGTAAEEEQQD
jgi:hypothetical protein